MLEKSTLSENKKDRFLAKMEKLVQKARDRHDKLVEKGCVFEQIDQNPGAGAHYIDHSDTCRSISDFTTGLIEYFNFRFD